MRLSGKTEASLLKVVVTQAAEIQQIEGLTIIFVGGAGPRYKRFGAWLATEPMDRQWDGSTEGTYKTPGQALRALADRLDEETLQRGWNTRDDE